MVHLSIDARTVNSGDPDAPQETIETEGSANAVARFSPRSMVAARHPDRGRDRVREPALLRRQDPPRHLGVAHAGSAARDIRWEGTTSDARTAIAEPACDRARHRSAARPWLTSPGWPACPRRRCRSSSTGASTSGSAPRPSSACSTPSPTSAIARTGPPRRCGRNGRARSPSSPTRSPSRRRPGRRSPAPTTRRATHGNMLLIAYATRAPDVLGAVLDDLLDRQVDAAVYATVGTEVISLPEAARTIGTVLVNCFAADDDLPCIVPDDEAGGHAAARLAIDAGHRRVAFLAGDVKSWATGQRLAGYHRALGEAGITPDNKLVRHGNYRADSGYELTGALLRSGDAADGDPVRQRPDGARRLPRPQGSGRAHPRGRLDRRLRRPGGPRRRPQPAAVDDPPAPLRDGSVGRAPAHRPLGRRAADAHVRPCPVVSRQSVGPPPGQSDQAPYSGSSSMSAN